MKYRSDTLRMLVAIMLWGAMTAMASGFSTVALAQTGALQASDFAYGYMLEVDGDGAIYGLSVPEDVYRNVTRADLGDVRVFNSEGRVVPMALRREPDAAAPAPETVNLPLFPLYTQDSYTQDGQTDGAMALHITTDMQGAIIDINGPPREASTRVAAYLLDASQLKRPVHRLRLHWSDAPASFVTEITVEGSDDLSHWHTVIGKVTLASLAFNARQLRRDEIILPAGKAKYLRIQWPAGRQGVVLDAVSAELSTPRPEAARQWLRIRGKPAAMPDKAGASRGDGTDSAGTQYLFDSGGYFPVDRVQVVLPQRNALVNLTLASRAAVDQPWQVRFSGVVYQFRVEGVELGNPVMSIPRVSDRYWRVQLDSPALWSEQQTPVLLLGWRPEQLLFVASGESPFRLAYGGAGVAPDRAGARALLRILATGGHDDIIKAAQPGGRIELGGAQRLQGPGAPWPWRQWLLWAILVLGTLAVGWMAWHLFRQLDTGGGQNRGSSD